MVMESQDSMRRWNIWMSEGIDKIRTREQELMWRFYEGVKDIPNVKVYGDFLRRTVARSLH